MRNLYVLQPYEVGSKRSKSKSLALVIPAKLVKQCKIDTSTVFALSANADTRTVTLQQTLYPIDHANQQQTTKPTGESLHAINQQAARAQ